MIPRPGSKRGSSIGGDAPQSVPEKKRASSIQGQQLRRELSSDRLSGVKDKKRQPSNDRQSSVKDRRNPSSDRLSVVSGRERADYTTPQRMSSSKKISMSGSERRGSNARMSYMGGKVVKDTRPLGDKQYQQAQVRKLLDFLRENGYPNTSLTSKHFPLSSKEFVLVFNFLYAMINPKTETILPSSRFEETLLKILKDLHYPGTITKSNFLTMGSIHSYPAVLGSLSFLCDIATIYRKLLLPNIDDLSFPNKDEFGFAVEGESIEKITFNHYINCNVAYNNEEDNFEQNLNDLRAKLEHKKGVDQPLTSLEEKNMKLNEELEELSGQENQLDGLKDKSKRMKEDQEKILEYIKTMDERVVNMSSEIENREKIINEINSKEQVLKEEIHLLKDKSETSTISLHERETKKIMLDDKRNHVKSVLADVEEEDKAIWQREIQASRNREKLSTIVKQINSISLEEELKDEEGKPLHLESVNFSTKDDHYEYLTKEFKSYVQKCIKDEKLMTRNVEGMIEDNGVALVKLQDVLKEKVVALNRLQEEIDSVKAEMEKSQDGHCKLDEDMNELKEHLQKEYAALRSQEGESVADLDALLNSLNLEVNAAKQLAEERKSKGLAFLKKVSENTAEYIEKSESQKKAAIEAVKKTAEGKLENIRESRIVVETMMEQLRK